MLCVVSVAIDYISCGRELVLLCVVGVVIDYSSCGRKQQYCVLYVLLLTTVYGVGRSNATGCCLKFNLRFCMAHTKY